MEEKEIQTSPHGWVIIFLIVLTLSVFLWAMVNTVDQEQVRLVRKKLPPTTTKSPLPITTTKPPMTTTQPPLTAVRVLRDGKHLDRHQKTDVVQDAIKRYVHSLPDKISVSHTGPAQVSMARDLTLHGYEIDSFSVGKSFYLYDCSIVPMDNYLMITLLMELPEIRVVFRDHPGYSMYCPTINPYIHVVELVYLWGYDRDTLETFNQMNLSNLRVFMVPWENNLYHKSYLQVKNSPLYQSDVPAPLHLKKEDLHLFLTKSGVLDQIPMIFQPPITLSRKPTTTPITA